MLLAVALMGASASAGEGTSVRWRCAITLVYRLEESIGNGRKVAHWFSALTLFDCTCSNERLCEDSYGFVF